LQGSRYTIGSVIRAREDDKRGFIVDYILADKENFVDGEKTDHTPTSGETFSIKAASEDTEGKKESDIFEGEKLSEDESIRRRLLAGWLDRGKGHVTIEHTELKVTAADRVRDPQLAFRLRGEKESLPFLSSFIEIPNPDVTGKINLYGPRVAHLFNLAKPHLILRQTQAGLIDQFQKQRLAKGQKYGDDDRFMDHLQNDKNQQELLKEHRKLEQQAQVPEVLDDYYVIALITAVDARNYRSSRRLEVSNINQELAYALQNRLGGSVRSPLGDRNPSFRNTISGRKLEDSIIGLENEIKKAESLGFYIPPGIKEIIS
jgi:hypothetical protein